MNEWSFSMEECSRNLVVGVGAALQHLLLRNEHLLAFVALLLQLAHFRLHVRHALLRRFVLLRNEHSISCETRSLKKLSIIIIEKINTETTSVDFFSFPSRVPTIVDK